jgi:predicted aspartyl protease/peroxiredoxin
MIHKKLKYSILPLLAILFFLLLTTISIYAAPKGYRITVKLKGNNSDTALLMAHYYGNKQYLDDTAFRNKQGFFEFTGAEKLPEGMYIIAGQTKNRYFDFFLTESQQMEFSCNTSDVAKTMEVKGSDENKQFYAYIRFLGDKQTEIEPLNKWKQSHKQISDSTSIVQKRIDVIDKEAKFYIKNFYTSNPAFLAAHFVKANNEPDIEPFLKKKADGKIDSTSLFPAYKEHFFDNIDFSDPRLIYTPVFANKIDYYLDKMVVPVVDSLQKDIDRLVELSSVNEETQKYLGWYVSLKYETSEVMGHDALFVYMVRKYLETGKVGWMYPSVKENIIKRVNTLEPLLLGKPAPNLVMLDTSSVARSLSSIKAKYTLVFFWESTCGHCQKEMPKVLKFYEEFHTAFDLEILGISGDTSLVKWKEFIRKNELPWINVNGHLSLNGNYHDVYDIHSTPIMYLLDEDKKILSKFLLTDQVSDLIRRREIAIDPLKSSSSFALGTNKSPSTSQSENTNIVKIKIKKESNSFVIPVKINGLSEIDFIFDTGATESTVTADVVSTMIRQKLISKEDFLPGKSYTLADGSVVRSQRFIIKTLEIGKFIFHDVEASISDANAEPLLGQNVLKNFKNVTQDNTNGFIILEK